MFRFIYNTINSPEKLLTHIEDNDHFNHQLCSKQHNHRQIVSATENGIFHIYSNCMAAAPGQVPQIMGSTYIQEEREGKKRRYRERYKESRYVK